MLWKTRVRLGLLSRGICWLPNCQQLLRVYLSAVNSGALGVFPVKNNKQMILLWEGFTKPASALLSGEQSANYIAFTFKKILVKQLLQTLLKAPQFIVRFSSQIHLPFFKLHLFFFLHVDQITIKIS